MIADLDIKMVSSIQEVASSAWDRLSKEQPFQSHQWYAFGERVMSDCPPTYLLAYANDELIARASLWLIRDEPVPKMPGPMRQMAKAMIKRWPLLICRSPLSFTTGLAIMDDARQANILSAFAETALAAARQQGGSFVIFDYLGKTDAHGWPHDFSVISASEPGTNMENRWASMDEYLASGGKKNRQHYKRVLREADKLGIHINRDSRVEGIDEALFLIRNVEQSHGAFPNPWARKMLEAMEMVNGLFLTATIEKRLVGCGLLLEDNASQMTCLLGLADDVPYVYFMLVYESLKIAFEHKVRLMRWGSGAYDVKKQLGFSVEDNGLLSFAAVNPFLRKALHQSNSSSIEAKNTL